MFSAVTIPPSSYCSPWEDQQHLLGPLKQSFSTSLFCSKVHLPLQSQKSRQTVLEGTLGVLYPSLSLKADSAILTIADKLPSILFTKKVTSSGCSIVSFSVSPTVSYVFTYRVLGKPLLIKSRTPLHHLKPNYFLPYP